MLNLTCYNADDQRAEEYIKGLTVESVRQSEYLIEIIFTNGSKLTCGGSSWGDNSLDVQYGWSLNHEGKQHA